MPTNSSSRSVLAAATTVALVAAWFVLASVPATAAAKPGDLDTTFGSPNGFATLDISPNQNDLLIQDLLVEPGTGKIVAAVATSGLPQQSLCPFGIGRFKPDGSLDTTFNPGGAQGVAPGIKTSCPTGGADSPFAVARTPDGKYVVAGKRADRILLVRYTADGEEDESFDGDPVAPAGTIDTTIPGIDGINRVAGVEVGPNGAITVAVTVEIPVPGPSTVSAIVVARYLPSGALDTTFDESPAVAPAGMVFVDDPGNEETVNGMLVDPTGRTVLSGFSVPEAGGTSQILVARLTPSGTRDTAFAGDGVNVFGVGAALGADQGADILRQPDGRLVLAAQVDPIVTPASFSVVGLTDSGQLDTGFGTGGYTSTPVGGVGELGLAIKLASEPNGRIVVGGNLAVPPGPAFYATVVRYEADGKLDTSYGSQGVAKPAPFATPNPLISGLAIDAQGRAVIGGSVQTTPIRLLLARFQGDPPPSNTAVPAITGTAVVGQVLTCSQGTWSSVAPPTFAFQWLRAGSVIAGATNATYTTVDADAGQAIVCRVTATTFAGSTSADSAELRILSPSDVPSNTGLPAITGTAAVGQALTCSQGTWSGATPQTYAFQWLRGGSAIADATGSTYTTVSADADQTIMCRVTATNLVGSASADSAGLAINSPPVVTISGKAKQDIDKLAVRVGSNKSVTLRGAGTVKPRRPAKPVRSKTATKSVAAGKKAKLRIKFAKKRLRQLKKLLDQGAKLKVKIKVTATDEAGNAVVVRKTVKLKD